MDNTFKDDQFKNAIPKSESWPTPAQRRETAEARALQLWPHIEPPHIDLQFFNSEMLRQHERIAFMAGFDWNESIPRAKPMTDVEVAGTVLKKLADVLEFIQAVRDMRHAQRSFFKERKNGSPKDAQQWLKDSKGFEKRVDDLIAKFDGKQEQKLSQNQTSLF